MILLLSSIVALATALPSALAADTRPQAKAAPAGYTVPAVAPAYGSSDEFMMFTDQPAVEAVVEDEVPDSPDDLSSSEVLHAFDAPALDADQSSRPEYETASSIASGQLETDMLSPLTVYNDRSKPHVDRNIKLFSVTLKDRFSTWLARSGKYVDMMKDVFREEGMPEDLVYIALIESGFNPKAYSWAKASGPWQFIKGTAKKYGLKIDSWVDERRDPEKSTRAAAAYLKDLYGMFGTWSLSMAAYNAGEGRVSRAVNKTGTLDFWKLSESRSIVSETREYVPRYIAAKAIAKDPSAFGLGPIEYEPPFEYDIVVLDAPVSLEAVAKCCDTSVDEIKGLNPELKRWCTPPNSPNYRLRVPKGMKETYLARYKTLPENDRSMWTEYVVRRGDTLNRIAARFSVGVGELADTNHIRHASRISIGQRLVIPGGNSAVAAAYVDDEPEAASSRSHSSTYKVRRGDTLSAIARKHGMSTTKLASLNGISSRSVIRSGQRLKVSGKASTVSTKVASSSGDSYRVRSGDTLWSISRKFGVSADSLKKANSLGRRSVIKPGQRLTIPSKEMDT